MVLSHTTTGVLSHDWVVLKASNTHLTHQSALLYLQEGLYFPSPLALGWPFIVANRRCVCGGINTSLCEGFNGMSLARVHVPAGLQSWRADV